MENCDPRLPFPSPELDSQMSSQEKRPSKREQLPSSQSRTMVRLSDRHHETLESTRRMNGCCSYSPLWALPSPSFSPRAAWSTVHDSCRSFPWQAGKAREIWTRAAKSGRRLGDWERGRAVETFTSQSLGGVGCRERIPLCGLPCSSFLVTRLYE